MLWRLTTAALGLALAGCGLTLDLEPPEPGPDGSVRDFGVARDLGKEDSFLPPEDLGPRADQGSADLGLEPDLGTERDAGTDLGVERSCADGCAETEYCETTLRVCLGTEGRCAPRPTEAECLATPESPVCGCDYRTYRNDCVAAEAGVVVALLEACPEFTDPTADWCDLEAPEPTMAGCVPCFDNADCFERTTTAFECVGSTCSSSGVGRCAFNLPDGRCYYDRDCRAGERCEGAELYGCDDPGGLVPVQGVCR